MLLIITISLCLIIILLSISVHLCQHFDCGSKQNNEESESKKCCNFENVHFLPMSFLLYMLLIAILCSVIIFKCFLDETSTENVISFIDLQKLIEFKHIFTKNTLSTFTSVQMSTSFVGKCVDYAIYCLIIMVILLESFFYFYRYYTTKRSAFFLHSPTLKHVVKLFSPYIIIMAILFLLQTQIYYYLFPVIILIYSLANIFCIIQTTRIVIRSAQLYGVTKQNLVTQEMKSSLIYNVLIMRYLSLISCLCSSAYVAAFMIIYDIKVVYLFPIIWTLSILCFMFQFIRDRQYIKHICCRTKMMSPEDKVTIEGSLFISVQNVDKDKAIQNPVRHQTIEQQPNNVHKPDASAISLPIIDFMPNLPIRQVSYHKFHSTGNLLALLQKQKQTVPQEQQLPLVQADTANTATQTLRVQQEHNKTLTMESTVYCGYDTQHPAVPSVQLSVIDSAQTKSTTQKEIDLSSKISQNKRKHTETSDVKTGSLHISVTKPSLYSSQDRKMHNLSVTTTDHTKKRTWSNTTTDHTKKSTWTNTAHSFTPSMDSKLFQNENTAKPLPLLDKISDATCDYSWNGSNSPTPITYGVGMAPIEQSQYNNDSNFALPRVNNGAIAEMTENSNSAKQGQHNIHRTKVPHALNYLGANLAPSAYQRRSQPSVSSVLQLFVAQGFSVIDSP